MKTRHDFCHIWRFTLALYVLLLDCGHTDSGFDASMAFLIEFPPRVVRREASQMHAYRRMALGLVLKRGEAGA